MKLKARRRSRAADFAGFSASELLVVLATLTLLAGLQAAGLGRSRALGHSEVCRANLAQLTRAWQFYAADHLGRLPDNYRNEAIYGAGTNLTWCAGWLDFAANPANTNVDFLLNGRLGPYVGSAEPYHCPADTSLSRGTIGLPRVRSVSMNCYVGFAGTQGVAWTAGYRVYVKLSDFVDLAPAAAFVFLDEREDSINDPSFAVDMRGYAPSNPMQWYLVDIPADWHGGAGNFSFADGHVETWRWQDPRTMPDHRPGTMLTLNIPSPNNADVARIQGASSRSTR